MSLSDRWVSSRILFVLLLSSMCLLGGCSNLTRLENAGLVAGTAAGITVAARSPTHEVEQTYYLGVFDPQDQLPPSIYRVRVRGQASFFNTTKFASGWVPANVIDSLGVGITTKDGRISIEKTQDDFTTFQTGRRLIMFGPEGFREAPANHRLVIVMGASPQAFFSAIDESLGVVAQATQEQGSAELERQLFRTLVETRTKKEQIEAYLAEIKNESSVVGGAK